MIIKTSIAKAPMTRPSESVQRLTPNRENVRQQFLPRGAVQLKRIETAGERAGSRLAASARPADGFFAQMLTAATSRREENLRGSAEDLRPLGQRSRLLGSLESAPSLLSQAMIGTGDANAHMIPEIPFADLILAAGKKYDVSPELVAAVVKAESGFSPLAQSRAGAKGLMQLMDGTARSLGVSNVFDPAQNIDGGVRFLSSLLRRYEGDPTLALAAYNAGSGAVDRFGGVPPYQETKNYVSTVLKYWRQFEQSTGRNRQPTSD